MCNYMESTNTDPYQIDSNLKDLLIEGQSPLNGKRGRNLYSLAVSKWNASSSGLDRVRNASSS